jgi:hypothetical protein
MREIAMSRIRQIGPFVYKRGEMSLCPASKLKMRALVFLMALTVAYASDSSADASHSSASMSASSNLAGPPAVDWPNVSALQSTAEVMTATIKLQQSLVRILRWVGESQANRQIKKAQDESLEALKDIPEWDAFSCSPALSSESINASNARHLQLIDEATQLLDSAMFGDVYRDCVFNFLKPLEEAFPSINVSSLNGLIIGMFSIVLTLRPTLLLKC